jgi:polyisoprenoid-binding protein YceI
MTASFLRRALLTTVLTASSATALAAPVKYTIDPSHTYPSFEADHLGGLSVWRGKFNNSTGNIVLDREAKTGSIEVQIDMASVDFGFDKMNTHAKSADMLDVAKYPTATYAGKLVNFKEGTPTEVEGTLTMHGVSKPVKLTINKFLCKQHPMSKKDVCGADAAATLNREDFGIAYGKQLGFNMDVLLKISVEGVKSESKTE